MGKRPSAPTETASTFAEREKANRYDAVLKEMDERIAASSAQAKDIIARTMQARRTYTC